MIKKVLICSQVYHGFLCAHPEPEKSGEWCKQSSGRLAQIKTAWLDLSIRNILAQDALASGDSGVQWVHFVRGLHAKANAQSWEDKKGEEAF